MKDPNKPNEQGEPQNEGVVLYVKSLQAEHRHGCGIKHKSRTKFLSAGPEPFLCMSKHLEANFLLSMLEFKI